MFAAHQYNQDNLAMTGHVEIYKADNIADAVKAVIYSHSIDGKEGELYVGPTGRVVHGAKFGYSIIPAK